MSFLTDVQENLTNIFKKLETVYEWNCHRKVLDKSTLRTELLYLQEYLSRLRYSSLSPKELKGNTYLQEASLRASSVIRPWPFPWLPLLNRFDLQMVTSILGEYKFLILDEVERLRVKAVAEGESEENSEQKTENEGREEKQDTTQEISVNIVPSIDSRVRILHAYTIGMVDELVQNEISWRVSIMRGRTGQPSKVSREDLKQLEELGFLTHKSITRGENMENIWILTEKGKKARDYLVVNLRRVRSLSDIPTDL